MSHPDRTPKADFSGVTTTLETTAERRGAPQAPSGNGATPSTYTVEKGDTLSHVAKQFYGKAALWKTIFDANRDVIDDPDLIQPGQVLRIPVEPDAEQ